MGTASNIKSRVNRLSVQKAITSTLQRLKLYNTCPPNGLVIYCGTVETDEGKIRQVNFDFQPFKPVQRSVYLCDDKFHTEDLNDLLMDDEVYGFIIIDGKGCLYGTVQGSNRQVLHKFSVDLPNKHGRGGQSALRFERIRKEKQHNFVRKVAEFARQLFLPNGQTPNVKGLVLAGSADFKSVLMDSNLFDQRLANIVLSLVDISYGGESGFNQAIEFASETLDQVKLIQEKKLLQKYMDEINMDTGKYCFMIEDTLQALEMGAVEDLIIWEDLDMERITLRNKSTAEESVVHLSNKELNQNDAYLYDHVKGCELEIVDKVPVIEWFADNYKNYGCALHYISDRSGEGTQFAKGFGGIGGILRWKVDFEELFTFRAQSKSVGEEEDFDSEAESVCGVEYGFDEGEFGF